jgi:hypothetical protein
MSFYREKALVEIEKLIPHFIASFNDETSEKLRVHVHIEAGHYSPDGDKLEEGWFAANVWVPHERGYVEQADIDLAASELKVILSQNDSKNQLKNLIGF